MQESDAPRRSQVGRNPKLVRLSHVIEMTSMSKSLIYALIAAGKFPPPIRISARAVRWIESEVTEYIATRPRAGSDRQPPRRRWSRSARPSGGDQGVGRRIDGATPGA